MKKILLFLFLSIFPILFFSQNNRTGKSEEIKLIKTEVNKNIETLGLIMSLAIEEEIFTSWFSKSAHLLRFYLKEFQKFKQHPAVIKAKYLFENDIFGWGSQTQGLYFSELPEFKIKYELPKDEQYGQIYKLTQKEIDIELKDFYSKAKDFYFDAKLDSFFLANNKVYEKIIDEIKTSLPDNNLISSMESYHGVKMAGYKIIPSLFIPNYINNGERITTDSGIINYFVLGPHEDIAIDSNSNETSLLKLKGFGFKNKDHLTNMGIHEFGHTFIRLFIYIPDNLKLTKSLSFLYTKALSDNMLKWGYGSWEACFEEHLVRLCELRIAKLMENKKRERQILKEYYKKEKFIYLPQLNQIIIEYESNRNKYKKIEDFLPKIIEKMAKIDTNVVKVK